MSLPTPTSNSTKEVSRLILCYGDTSFLKQALMKLKWKMVNSALVFPKAMAQDGLVYTFTYMEKRLMVFYV